jgi:S-formylglutathione hydrolase FrmB
MVGRDRTSASRRPLWRAVAFLALVVAAVAVVLVIGAAVRTHTLGARVVRVTVWSRLLHRRVPLTLVVPAGGGAGRPLLVFLHGRGGDQDSEISDELFKALSKERARAPDIAFPYGGDHSYWHDRADARWGSYVVREVIPQAVAILHADSRRLAIGGISMGGFGAYDLARSEPGRFCAVGGHSAALWATAGATAPGAFDDAGDFARHDVIAAARADPRRHRRARLWLDGGEQDPFHAADETLAHALGIRMHVWPGGHDSDYWTAHYGDYLRFYAGALAACRP